MSTERRTRYRRPCSVPGCEWWQTTEWYVGGPDTSEPVPEMFLRTEAEAHLMSAHFAPQRSIFV